MGRKIACFQRNDGTVAEPEAEGKPTPASSQCFYICENTSSADNVSRSFQWSDYSPFSAACVYQLASSEPPTSSPATDDNNDYDDDNGDCDDDNDNCDNDNDGYGNDDYDYDDDNNDCDDNNVDRDDDNDNYGNDNDNYDDDNDYDLESGEGASVDPRPPPAPSQSVTPLTRDK